MNPIRHRNTSRRARVRQPHRRRRSTGGWRLVCSLVLTYALVLPLAGVPAAVAQSGPNPGANDPVNAGRYNALFPSHDIALLAPAVERNVVQVWKGDSSWDEANKPVDYDQPPDADNVVAAAGRIWSPNAEQVMYARRPGGGSRMDMVFVAEPPTGYASASFNDLAPRLDASADFMDIAAGDLDNVPDSAGNNHDEVVVAYASTASSAVKVVVLDFTAPASTPPPSAVAQTAAFTSAPLAPSSNFATAINQSAILPVDNILGVAVGDFDGDGRKEIATAHLSDHQTLVISTFRYTKDGNNTPSLTLVSTSTANPAPNSNYSGTLDVAAGDFDGKGADELLVGGAVWEDRSNRVSQVVVFQVWQSDSNLKMTGRGSSPLPANTVKGAPGAESVTFQNLGGRTRVQVSPGLFKYDPGNGFDLNRRQFAAAWNLGTSGGGEGSLALATFEVSDQLIPVLPTNELYYGPKKVYQRFSMAAGAYNGNATSPPPGWRIAIASWDIERNTSGAPIYGLDLLENNLSRVGLAFEVSAPGDPGDGFQRFPVVPMDLEGNSVYLGAPTHITLEQTVNTDFILQEPPKHAFYDNRPGSGTYGRIIDVSRKNDFNVSLLTSQSQSFSATAKDSSAWNIGGSVAVSAGATVGAGIPDIDDASVSIDVTAKVGYDYNQNKESYNSNYSQTTLTQTEATNADDKIIGRLQDFDIWRYRVYGISVTDQLNNTKNGFYEVVLPGPFQKFDIAGRDSDSYQPMYENGNLLSYPLPPIDNKLPDDIGSYRVPCPADKVAQCVPCKLASDPSCTLVNGKSLTLPVAQPLVAAGKIGFDGTSGTLSYDYKNTENTGSSFGYSHKLAESAEVKVGFEATIDTVVDNTKVRASVDTEFHNSNSWGGSETSDTSTTSETGITLNRPVGDSNQAYAFFPTFYIAQDGTVKVTHAVDIFGANQGAFWAGIYGRLADPALNLPARFSQETRGGVLGWVPNSDLSRKRMRGFFVRKADINPVTNTYDLLFSNPAAGDRVRLEARVYNYTTNTENQVNNLKVRFQVIGYDKGNNREVALTSCPGGGAPQGGRCTVGDVIIPQMAAQEMTTPFITWDTTGYGPAQAGGASGYRIYVVLDPDNTIDETYETENPDTQYPCVDFNGSACNPALPEGVDPGQNNEGFGYVTVQHPTLGAQPGASVGADVSMNNRSLGAAALWRRNGRGDDDRGARLRFNRALAQVNRPVSLRATVNSDRTHTSHSHLLVYDGDPEKGGRTIANKTIHSGDTTGSHFWFEWTPTTLGKHTLYAKVFEKSHDSKPGNNTDTLEVNVVPGDIIAPQLTVTLTPGTLRPADDRMAPVAATISVKDDYDQRPEIKLEAITHDEGNDASGDVSGAEFGTDDRTFSLRARHDGRRRDARVYEVVYSATDWAGNKTFAKAYVIVPQRARR